MRKDDLIARILGIIVFLGGVGLLVFSFGTAYNWFTNPSAGLSVAPQGTTPATTQLGASAIQLLIRLGLLLVMTIIGSLLAGRGTQIYFAATPRHPSIYPNEE